MSDSLQSLNCVKTGMFLPSSLSLHSVDLPDIGENGENPGMMTVTLRCLNDNRLYRNDNVNQNNNTDHEGLIRVVHGTKEVHEIIRKSASEVLKLSIAKTDPETEAETETSVDDNQVKETSKSGVWSLSLANKIFSGDFSTLEFCCKLLEKLVKVGWEVQASPCVISSPGYEFSTWIMKKSTSPPLHNAQVASIAIGSGKISVVSDRKEIQINNAIDRAIKKCVQYGEAGNSPIKRCTPAELEKPDTEDKTETAAEEQAKETKEIKDEKSPLLPQSSRESISRLFGAKAAYKDVKDDVDCPSEFEINTISKKDRDSKSGILESNLVLEIVHLLFCRQWKLIANSTFPNILQSSENGRKGMETSQTLNIYYFCRDGRILPSLGQQTFAMLEFEQPCTLRTYNCSKEIHDELINSSLGSFIADKNATQVFHNVLEYKCRSDENFIGPWQTSFQIDNADGNGGMTAEEFRQIEVAKMHKIVSDLLLCFNKQGLNLYAKVATSDNCPKRTQFIFKQSNVSYSESVCLHLSGGNRIYMVGSFKKDKEVAIVTQALAARWPYPVVKDCEVQPGIWLFKVKRYPFLVSYGNKHVDRMVETTKSLIKQVSLPPPQNMDADSGKSLLVFILKGLAQLGWRTQASASICSETIKPSRYQQPKPSDPDSFFLLK